MSKRYVDEEASRYAKPICSREDLLALMGASKRSMNPSAVAKALGYRQSWQREALQKRLDAMVRDGQLRIDHRGHYRVGKLMAPIEGEFCGIEEGSGRVLANERVYTLPAYQCIALMIQDRVQIRPTQRYESATLIKVLERVCKRVVGLLSQKEGQWWLSVHGDAALRIQIESDAAHKEGLYAEAVIIRYPSVKEPALGRVDHYLPADHPLDFRVHLTLTEHNIPHKWPQGLREATEKLPVFDMASSDRVDLRDKPFVTIDGESARDFDDAVYAESLPNGAARVWVAIADVAHYVEEGGALDREAKLRGNSIYFPNKVIPMLPDRLSNDLCSLVPHQDRPVVVADVIIDAQGEIQKSRFYRAAIHSFARLTYTQVQAMIDEDAPIVDGWQKAFAALLSAHRMLEGARERRGCLHFSMHDQQVSFDERGCVSGVAPVEQLEAHVLIENIMLLANESVARLLNKVQSKAALYRMHEGPSEEKWETAYPFLRALGLHVPKDHTQLTPQHYQSLLKACEDHEQKDNIHRVLLRTMQQAIYTPHPSPHFGLSYPLYTHFTSPIRRYPDLVVHRALLRHLGLLPKAKKHVDIADIARHCSMSERRAEGAEREVKKALMCMFMQDKVGDRFAATVRSVTAFGLFVEIDEMGIEGLVHISRLPSDYYVFEEETYQLKGRASKRIFALGDRFSVVLDRVDVDKGRIDFLLAAE